MATVSMAEEALFASEEPRGDGGDDEPEPAVCQACRRPIRSEDARRTGYGSHCRRKGRPRPGPRPAPRGAGGRFEVDQDPLPEP